MKDPASDVDWSGASLFPRIGWGWIVALAFSVGCSNPRSQPSTVDIFRGRTLRIIVGTSAGGGYDLGARVLAAHFGRHIPGEPAIVVENMAGAGGMLAANFLARQAQADGLTIGFIGENAVIAQLTQQPGVQFDVRQFGAIGSPTGNEADVCVLSRASGFDIARWQASRVPLRMGVTSRGSGPYARTVLLSAALRLPVRLIVGYQGTAQIRLAIEGGEVDGLCTLLSTYRSTFEPKANFPIVLQDSDRPDPLLAAVPSAASLVTDASGQALLRVSARIRALTRYYVVPPATPTDRLQLLRTAFDETMRDPEFLRAAAAAQLDIDPLPAADITARAAAVFDLPEDVRGRVIGLLLERTAP